MPTVPAFPRHRAPAFLLLAAGVCAAGLAAAGGPAPAPAATPPFVDATARVGLDFVHVNGMSGQRYIVEVLGAGVALFDMDNDGDLDLYVRQGMPLGPKVAPGPGAPTDRLYRNDLVVNADGSRALRFTDVTAQSAIALPAYGMGVAAGDYDNDGFTDLYLTNFGSNRMLRNLGGGRFADVTAKTGTDDPRFSVPASFFDYDRDGWLDLYVGDYVDFTWATHHTCYYRSRPDYCGPLAYKPLPGHLFHNRRDGSFEDVTARAGLGGALANALGSLAADVDRDGWPDLFVASDAMENQLWINDHRGGFKNEAAMRGCAVNGAGNRMGNMGVDLADFDGDADEDLFVTHIETESHVLWVNTGGGMFLDGTVAAGLAQPTFPYTGFGAGFVDYDNDGHPDILLVNGAVRAIEALQAAGDPFPLHSPKQLFRNLGNGRFQEVSVPALRISEVGRGVALGDLDNDGDTDAVVTNNNGPARVLLNEVGQSRPWLGLRLVGGRGRSDRLGAYVEIQRPGRPPVVRHVRADGSYAAAQDPRILIGLGDQAAVSGVRAFWPDGRVEDFRAPKVNAYTTLVQGTGRPAKRAAR
jgi:hypothetical protein